MSFPSSFSAQVAAIMEVLSKAAVAEITKLATDGAVELRLEMRQRDSEIQELKTSLQLMDAELCRAQETAKQHEQALQTLARNQMNQKDEIEDHEHCALYLEPNSAVSLCGAEEIGDMRPAVKQEPVTLETNDHTHTTTQDICFNAGEQNDPIWPPPACSMFENSAVSMQEQIQMFSSHSEQYAAHTNTENPFNSLSTTEEEIADASLSVPIKVEVEVRPVCMGSNTTSGEVPNELFRHNSHPTVTHNPSLQPALQQAGPSLAPLPLQRPTPPPNTEGHTLSRNNLRTKRLVNFSWRASPKLFVCSECKKCFPRLSQLEEHRATHQAKRYKCLECGKSFTQKTRLKTHQSVHTGERPFSCKICGKMFSRQDNCLRHERFHSGLRPFSCGVCGKSFTALGNLKIHQEIHLQQGRYRADSGANQ